MPSGNTEQAGVLARWARFAVRHRGTVLLGWGAVLILLIMVWRTAGGQFTNSFRIPGTESQRALSLLKERFPQRAGGDATLVFKSEAGVTSAAVKPRIDALIEQVRTLPEVTSVGALDQAGAGAVSADGRISYVTVQYGKLPDELKRSNVQALFNLADRSAGDGLTVEVGGNVSQQGEREPPGKTEFIGIVFAIFILLVAFGSVVAMGLPVATALIGLIASFAVMGLSARSLDLPSFTSQFASMIGIGVGIDYALFVVTRYREGLAAGKSVEDSIVQAVNTAGRAVTFAGSAVVIAMLGLLAMGIPFVGALGITGATVVAVAVVVAVTLLPALLAYTGRRIDRWSIPFFHATDTGDQSSIWYRLSAMIQRRPVLWFAGSLALLLVLGAPVLSMRLGSADAGNNSTALHSRRAYDLLAEGFGPGFNGPLTVVFDLQGAGADAQSRIDGVIAAIRAWPGVARVSPLVRNPQGDAAILTVMPSSAPQDAATRRMVHDLRTQALPPAIAGSGLQVYVAGPTAAFIDIGDRITSRLPVFFGAVIGLSFLLLMTVFRSVIVALKAAIMNLLSIGAAYGVVVAIFQWGWGATIVGIKEGPIETFLPMMLFAILFGLSMDYEVFLISRVREEYLRTGRNADAVAHGLAVTARVITAAASIMVVVFLSFVLGPNRVIKEFGLGLATAIFVDATVVRLILVPSTMELLGDANWWLPRWLHQILPHLDVEGAREPEPAIAAAD